MASRANESCLKALALRELRRSGAIDNRAILASEFQIARGTVRADLAILSRKFIGIEIKSELDSLRRLQSQSAMYGKYFEHVIIILAPKHAQAAEQLDIPFADIWLVGNDGKVHRSPRRPQSASIPPYARLLTKAEWQKFRLGAQPKYSNDRDAFAAAFSSRYGQTSRKFWEAVSGRPISPADIAILSRYREGRAMQASIRNAREAREAGWSHAASKYLRVA